MRSLDYDYWSDPLKSYSINPIDLVYWKVITPMMFHLNRRPLRHLRVNTVDRVTDPYRLEVRTDLSSWQLRYLSPEGGEVETRDTEAYLDPTTQSPVPLKNKRTSINKWMSSSSFVNFLCGIYILRSSHKRRNFMWNEKEPFILQVKNKIL